MAIFKCFFAIDFLSPKRNFLAQLRRGALEAFILQGVGMGLLMLMQITLGRLLGSRDYGVFSYALAWANTLAVFICLGFPNALTRLIPQYQELQTWSLLGGVIRRAHQLVFPISLLFSFGVWLFTLQPGLSPELATGIRFSAPLLPLIALVRLRSGVFQGLKRIQASIILEQIVLPLLVISGLIILAVHSATGALAVYVMMAVIVLIAGSVWLARTIPPEARQARPEYLTRTWILITLPMVAGGISQIVMNRIDVLALGTIKGADAVGIYNAANRLATILTFVLSAVNTIAAPMISSAFHGGRPDELKTIVSRTTLWATLGAMPIFILLIVAPSWLLSFFGPQFTQGVSQLRILAVGQLINAITGPVGIVLLMTGHERSFAKITAGMAVVSIAGNILAISLWGAVGAALATAMSVTARNLILYGKVRYYFKYL